MDVGTLIAALRATLSLDKKQLDSATTFLLQVLLHLP